jgi:hypothetical protein
LAPDTSCPLKCVPEDFNPDDFKGIKHDNLAQCIRYDCKRLNLNVEKAIVEKTVMMPIPSLFCTQYTTQSYPNKPKERQTLCHASMQHKTRIVNESKTKVMREYHNIILLLLEILSLVLPSSSCASPTASIKAVFFGASIDALLRALEEDEDRGLSAGRPSPSSSS